MRRLIPILSMMFLCAPAFAQFEGAIDMKISASGGSGKITIYISEQGVRNDVVFSTPQGPMKMSMLVKSSNPDIAYSINNETKTYSELDWKKLQKGPAREKDVYVLKDLGSETLHGYSCRHVLLTNKLEGETELWTTREIMDFDSFAKAMGPRSAIKASFEKSLKDAGADGFAVKMIQRSGKETVVTELEKLDKKSLPASMFQIPAGYKEEEGFGGAGAMRPPEGRKSMEEAMKNMSPEHREIMQKMMKK